MVVCLEKICDLTIANLKGNHIEMKHLLADTAYSSGEALKYLEANNIDAYIPNFGQYKPERGGFIYNKDLDRYECQRGNKAILPFKGIRTRHDEYLFKQYRSSVTYNLKKYLKFVSKKTVSKVIAMEVAVNTCFPDGFSVFWLIFRSFEPLFLGNENHKTKNNHSLEWLF